MKHKSIKRIVCGAIVLAGVMTTQAAQQTWVGKISDSMCGASHKAMEHGGKKVGDRECVQACVKDGAQYVLASKGKVYQISNQDFAGLTQHAGHTVKVTGEMSGDSIRVSKIEMTATKSKTTEN